MHLVSTPNVLRSMRRKAPQILVAAIVIIVAVYLLFEILDGVVIGGAPMTSGPLIGACLFFNA